MLRDALADRYEVDRAIGRGDMAVVFLAHDLKYRRRVALKVLTPELSVTLAAERFLREIEIAAQLVHPHVLALYESGEAAGLLYYVTPFIEGGTLRDRLRKERGLPVHDAIRIATEVADALAYAHGQGVVHRDIKPENILLAGDHAWVADFGVARAVRHAALDGDLTQPGFALGTPGYRSPEQAAGTPAVDSRSDVYSLGCVLYEMLAGVPPFGDGERAVTAGAPRDAPPRLQLRRPTVPPAVQRVVETAIAELPADRFATAADFAQHLAAATRADRRGVRVGWLARAAASAVTVTMLAVRRPARSTEPNAAVEAAGAVVRDSPGATPSVGVVVLPFDPGAVGDAAAARAASAAQQLLIGDIEGLPVIRALDGAALLAGGQSWRRASLPDLRRHAERLGGRYLALGGVTTREGISEVSVDVYAVRDGRRVSRSRARADASGLDAAVGRVALEAIRAVVSEEGLLTEDRRVLLSSTSSAVALAHLLQGQRRFRESDHDGAVDEYRRAIEADSSCALAYHRLSVAQVWRHQYPAALATAEAGLARRAAFAPEWVDLLEAQRHYVRFEGADAIARFQSTVQDRPGNLDGWLGLGESLIHFGWFTGHPAADGRQALETLVRRDSTFAPIDYHLVDLALDRGDAAGARRALARVPAADRERAPREAVLALRFDGAAARAATLRRLASADRYTLSEAVAILMVGAHDVALVDTIASFLTADGRTPDDRLRGAQYRLVTGALLDRWPERLAAWARVAPRDTIDAWLAQAYLAGYPIGDHVVPMLRRARALVAAGRAPDFTKPFEDETFDAFLLLVHEAVRTGSASEVQTLRRALDRTARRADASDPLPHAVGRTLDARLALVAGDTAAAVRLLGAAVTRVGDPFTHFFPMRSMATERMLIADLLASSGQDPERIRPWTRSFSTSRNVADHFFESRARRVQAGADGRRSSRGETATHVGPAEP
ncbi:MAG: protein kinase domain-containing protein [Gemmatirosa sp.]